MDTLCLLDNDQSVSPFLTEIIFGLFGEEDGLLPDDLFVLLA